jgi:hypothetical protein
VHSKILNEGDTHRNFPLEPHQLICIKQGVIIEVSTPDSVEDNYRVMPGDSQANPTPPPVPVKRHNRKRKP